MKKNPMTAPLIYIKLSMEICAIYMPKHIAMTENASAASETFRICPCFDYYRLKILKKRFLF